MPPARLALWLVSLLGLTVTVRGILGQPPPLGLTAALLVGLCLLATAGVLFPGLNVYATVIERGKGNGKTLALTFDDGPHPETTRRVLEILAAHDARATFFVMGRKVEAYPDVLREIVAAGHTLGLHGFAHDRLYALRSVAYVTRDIERSQNAIEKVCGARPRLFRPPIGFVSHATGIAAERAGLTLVGWSQRGFDGRRHANRDAVLGRLLRALSPGAILLLHDAAEREDFAPVAPELLSSLLDAVKTAGLRVVSVEELLQ